MKVKIDGIEYDLPERLTLGEARVLEKYSDGHMDSDGYGVSKLMGMIHVAVKRARPELSFEEIRDRIEDLDPDQLAGFDAGPPSQSASAEPSDSSNESSDATSTLSPESENHGNSGSPDSDTGSGSVHRISAA